MKKKKILITGYNGYIGRNLLKFLRKKKIITKKIDLSKLSSYKLKGFTHLVHLKFYIKNNRINIKKNINDINKVINFCKKNNLFLFFPSTACFKYKKKKRLSNKIYVINNYTFAKKKCEELILDNSKKNKLNYCILRIFNVYGGDIQNRYFISNIIRKFQKSKKIKIKFKNNFRDYLYMDDLCKLIFKIISKTKTGIFEAGTGRTISIKKLVILINNIYNKKLFISFVKPFSTKNNSFSKSNIYKTIKTFKWRPKISLKVGLKNILKNRKN